MVPVGHRLPPRKEKRGIRSRLWACTSLGEVLGRSASHPSPNFGEFNPSRCGLVRYCDCARPEVRRDSVCKVPHGSELFTRVKRKARLEARDGVTSLRDQRSWMKVGYLSVPLRCLETLTVKTLKGSSRRAGIPLLRRAADTSIQQIFVQGVVVHAFTLALWWPKQN